MVDLTFRVADNAVAHALPLTEEAPVHRCVSRGAGALSTVELIAILLGRGCRGKTAMEVAQTLFHRYDGLRGMSGAGAFELAKAAGMGLASGAKVLAALELSRRFAEEEVRIAETLGGAEEAFRFLKPRLRDLPHETFAVIFLNQKHGVLAYRELFRGTVSASSVHPREVVKEVLKENAAAVILAHNHPSGHVSPSPDDLRLTEDLRGLLKHLDVRVIDHLILGGNGYFSFAREGLLAG